MPDFSELYHQALSDYRHHHFDEAILKLKQALELNPSSEDALEALSVIYHNQKRYDEAIAIIQKWIALNPNSIMSHTNMSRCYMAKGMILEAEREQNEARRLTWKEELKTKKMEMPKVNFDEQIERYKKVIDFDPKDVLGYFTLGSVYLEAGRKREAMETFEKAVEVDPTHSSSYLGYGMALEGLLDVNKAKEIYLRGIKVAETRGDLMTQKKMESRLRALEENK